MKNDLYPQKINTETNEIALPTIIAYNHIAPLLNSPVNNLNDINLIYQELVQRYQHYEKNLNTLFEEPLASIMGGIHYGMSLDKMKKAIKMKFEEMQRNGYILSASDFEAIKDDYFISYSFKKPHKDLTRLWGAQYLKDKLKQYPALKKKYAVPDYIIVLDDPTTIEVTVSFYGFNYPIVSQLLKGAVYFKKIKGSPACSKTMELDLGEKTEIGFRDFFNEDNILKDETTNINYIVDTELRSFKFPISNNLSALLEYAAQRFFYLNDDLQEYSYEFKLND